MVLPEDIRLSQGLFTPRWMFVVVEHFQSLNRFRLMQTFAWCQCNRFFVYGEAFLSLFLCIAEKKTAQPIILMLLSHADKNHKIFITKLLLLYIISTLWYSQTEYFEWEKAGFFHNHDLLTETNYLRKSDLILCWSLFGVNRPLELAFELESRPNIQRSRPRHLRPGL